MPISKDIPTEIKKSPKSRPLKGSMEISNSCRYSESANNTPAIKVPIAIEKPRVSIKIAAPNTTSSAAAVKTSLTPDFTTKRKSGRNK